MGVWRPQAAARGGGYGGGGGGGGRGGRGGGGGEEEGAEGRGGVEAGAVERSEEHHRPETLRGDQHLRQTKRTVGPATMYACIYMYMYI